MPADSTPDPEWTTSADWPDRTPAEVIADERDKWEPRDPHDAPSSHLIDALTAAGWQIVPRTARVVDDDKERLPPGSLTVVGCKPSITERGFQVLIVADESATPTADKAEQ